jgi:hypothetical protein
MATFALNVASGDADPLAWHLVSLVLHAANAALLAAVALHVGRGVPGSAKAALVAGVALALFPPAVEAIAWPVAPFALSSRVIVQVVPELPQWPGLLARDAVGRLMREPLIDTLRVPPPPAREPPYRLPDHFLCWDAREHVLRPVVLDLAPDAGNWDAAWARALASPACAQVQP